MANSPLFKVYDASGTYQAACKEVEAAAAVVTFYGSGATIRYRHGPVLWREGADGGGDGTAAESYDGVAEIAGRRIRAHQDASIDKAYGAGTAARLAARTARAQQAIRAAAPAHDEVAP